jgi:hypothetical protein
MSGIIDALTGFWISLPRPVAAGIVLAVGWAGATFARFILTAILVLAKFEKMSERAGFAGFLRKGGVKYGPSKLIGTIAYWLALLITFLSASRMLDIIVVNSILEKLLASLSGWLSALLIVIVGAIIVSFLSNFAITIARNAGHANVRPLGKTIKYAGNILIAALALDQIGLGKNIINGMLGILFAALVFGCALAFGLGCKDIARETMVRFMRNLREKRRDSQGDDLEG